MKKRKSLRSSPGPSKRLASLMLGVAVGGISSHALAQSFTSIVSPDNSPVKGEVVTSGTQSVERGGETFGIVVADDGVQRVIGGASVDGSFRRSVAVDTIIDTDGRQTVGLGGLAIGASLRSNQGAERALQEVFGGGEARGTRILAGGIQQVRSGGTANDTSIEGNATSFGFQNVQSGGHANRTTINNQGAQIVEPGGVVSGTIVNSGGLQAVNVGGRAEGTQINTGGVQDLDGESIGAVISGGVQHVSKDQPTGTVGVASNTTILVGGVQEVFAGGKAVGTVINSGGIQVVNPLGRAAVTQINGGLQILQGRDDNAVLNSGEQDIQSGGSAFNAVVNGGLQRIEQGGVATQATVNGGVQDLAAGGRSVQPQVGAGGTIQHHAGGTLDGAQVAGRIRVMEDGASAINTLTLHGGLIDFTSPAVATQSTQSVKSVAAMDLQTPQAVAPPYKRYTVDRLVGSGRMAMRTDVAADLGDQLIGTQSIDGQYEIAIQDASNRAPDPTKKLTLVQSPAGSAQFRLKGNSADVGAFEYVLEKNGNEWQLAPTPKPTQTTTVAQALASAPHAVWGAQLQQLYKRLGDLRLNPQSNGIWARTYGTQIRLTANDAPANTKLYGLEVGADHRFATERGDWYVGGMFDAAHGDQDFGGSNTGTAKPWSVGAYATWLHPEGWYGDFVVRYNAMSQDFRSQASGSPVTASYHQKGYTMSAEGGKRVGLANGWWVQPELELTALHAQGVTYRTSYGTQIQQSAATSWLTRLELRTGKAIAWQGDATKTLEPYVGLGVVQRWGSEPEVTVAGSKFSSDSHGAYGLLTAGVAAQFSPNFMLYANLAFAKGKHYEQPWLYNVGLRYAF